jgi:WD40 repeat protein
MKRLLWSSLVVMLILAACAVPATLPATTGASTPGPATPTRVPALSPTPTLAPTLSPETEPVNAILIAGAGDRFRAQPVDPQTLGDLPGYEPLELRHHYTGALSPDGRTWAVIVWSADSDWGGVLHLIDLGTWTDTTTAYVFDGYVPDMKFSPDGSRLVVVANDETGIAHQADVSILDLHTLEETARIPFDFFLRQLQFSPDGRQFYLYGTPPGEASDAASHLPMVSAFETDSGESVWSIKLEGMKDGWFKTPTEADPAQVSHFVPGIAFSNDGRWLYVISSDEDRMARVDLEAGAVETLEITEPRSWLDRLIALTAGAVHAKGPVDGAEKTAVLSPDGTRLYVTGVVRAVQAPAQGGQGEFQVDDVASGLEVIDPQTGTRLDRMDTSMTVFGPSPDGRWLYMHRIWQWYESGPPDAVSVQVLDASSLAPAAVLAPGTAWVGLELSADGSLLQLTTSQDVRSNPTMTVQLLDAQTRALIAVREVPGWALDLLMTGTSAKAVQRQPEDGQVSGAREICPVTEPVRDAPPDDPHADPFAYANWYVNSDRSIWVGPSPEYWNGGVSNKVMFIRPQGTDLKVTGRRLDAGALPLETRIPCCYPTGFQVASVYFPTPGCWEVTAAAGDSELTFVTQVK